MAKVVRYLTVALTVWFCGSFLSIDEPKLWLSSLIAAVWGVCIVALLLHGGDRQVRAGYLLVIAAILTFAWRAYTALQRLSQP